MMLCKNGNETDVETKNQKWIGSKKFDGVRCLAYCKNGVVVLMGRNGSNYTSKFLDVVENLKNFNGVLDSEITCGTFQNTQSRTLTENKLKQKILIKQYPAILNVFDILYYNSEDLREFKLSERLRILNKVLEDNSVIKKVETTTDLIALFEKAKVEKWEGIVIKNPDSIYRENCRSDNWLKVKLKKSKDLKFIKYEVNNAGIRAETEKGIAIQISGLNSQKVKEQFDTKGYAILEVEFLEEFASGNLRQPIFKDIKEQINLITKEKYEIKN